MGLFSTGGAGGVGDGGLTSFGTSLVGNGFTNEGSSGGVTGSNPSFDLNDFPSLGGGATGAAGPGSAGSDNGLAAALRQQQQLLQQQMMQQGAGGLGVGVGGIGIGGVGVGSATNSDKSNVSNLYRLAMSSGMANGGIGGGPSGVAAGNNFSMTTEDFPALGASGGDGAGGVAEGTLGGGAPAPSSSGSILDPSSNQLDYTGLIGGTGGAVATATSSAGGIQRSGSSGSDQTRPTSTSTTPGTNATSGSNASSGTSGGAIGGDYGLLGLLSVIRMTDADRNRLALGSDLTVLGLNLNSPDVLYSTFGGPFSDKPATKEPHYQLPMCYYMQPPALKTGHLSKFQLETLFYIFYALPKDVLQAYAAQELYTREWRYHAESKLWFKRATGNSSDVTVGGNGGSANSNSSSSSPQYIYFDINTWERRVYGNVNTNIAGGFLPEDDVRVKFPSS